MLWHEETPKDWNQVPTKNARDLEANQINPSFPSTGMQKEFITARDQYVRMTAACLLFFYFNIGYFYKDNVILSLPLHIVEAG